ncbi:hypothetical protein K456DRAFT_30314 [Colletotrichum gloeosporioides 23]|nr:hypothetical protein K456DRAFT_30314 [Colletotrichum gloeosporioides 23]
MLACCWCLFSAAAAAPLSSCAPKQSREQHPPAPGNVSGWQQPADGRTGPGPGRDGPMRSGGCITQQGSSVVCLQQLGLPEEEERNAKCPGGQLTMGDTIGTLAGQRVREREMLGTCPSGTWAARRADNLTRQGIYRRGDEASASCCYCCSFARLQDEVARFLDGWWVVGDVCLASDRTVKHGGHEHRIRIINVVLHLTI